MENKKRKEKTERVRKTLANEKQVAEGRLERLREDSDPLPYRTIKNRRKVEYQEKRIYLIERVIEWLNESGKKEIDLKKLTNKTKEIENTLHQVKFDKKLENRNMENYTFRQGILSGLHN